MSISSVQDLVGLDPLLQLIIAGVFAALLITVIGLLSERSRRKKASTNNDRAAKQPVEPVAQPVPQPAAQPAAQPVAPAPASAPSLVTPVAAPVPTGSGNGTANTAGSGSGETASWASMPGGWQVLKASGVATNIAGHGDYPLDDGVARTAAGTIIR